MLYAIVRQTAKPIRIVSWFYSEPGLLSEVRDNDGNIYSTRTLRDKNGKIVKKDEVKGIGKELYKTILAKQEKFTLLLKKHRDKEHPIVDQYYNDNPKDKRRFDAILSGLE